jgi:multiple sugar transport system substrate-binding protein
MYRFAMEFQLRHGKRTNRWIARVLMVAACGFAAFPSAAETLVIDYVVTNGAQRSAWTGIFDQFSAANPDIRVTYRGYPPEQYKREFLARLQSAPADLALWYAGERMNDAVKAKLLAPLDADTVALMKKTKFAPATIEGTRMDGGVYGFPLYHYTWGFLYRKPLFERLGILPPATWSEFRQVCERLRAAGVTPLGLGASNGWPAAGWFDYLNLRINGIEFHRRLLRGEEQFSDPRVRQVFDAWGELLRSGYFLEATMEQDWDRVLPHLYRDRVGMMLIGGFAAARFPDAVALDMGMFRFPSIAPGISRFEEAPLDVMVLPAKAKNTKARKRFLAYLAESGTLLKIADADQTMSAQAGGLTSANSLRDDMLAILDGAAGLTFFFDRDAKAALVAPAFDGFRQFLKAPYDTDRAVRDIDSARRKAQ